MSATTLVHTDTIRVNDRIVTRDTEVTIRGEGRCRFIEHVHNTANDAEWVTVIDRHRAWRSFDPARITTVHSKPKTKENAA